MKKINLSTKELIQKFSSTFSFFKDKDVKEENKKSKSFCEIHVDLKDIEDISDLERGMIVIHKSHKLYKIYDFGMFQFLDKWHQAVYYKEVFPTDATNNDTLYGRTFENFKNSFKIVENFKECQLILKKGLI